MGRLSARYCLLGGLAVLSSTLPACAPSDPARQYELRGQILAVRADSGEVVIKHGDITGFMPGMTMSFPVRDSGLLRDKAPGDLVIARLMVGDSHAWLATLEKVGAAPLPDESAAGSTSTKTVLLKPGDVAPQTVLMDDRGQPRSLGEWRGLAVAVTFIYTRCPLPQYCPLMDRRFAEVQELAQADPVLRGRVRLLSVSFDPETDRTEVLRAHARELGADAAVWCFATAERDVVDRFAAAFGVTIIREDDGSITHNLRTAVIGPDGRVRVIRSGTEWTAQQIVGDMRQALGGPGASVTEARGETLLARR